VAGEQNSFAKNLGRLWTRRENSLNFKSAFKQDRNLEESFFLNELTFQKLYVQLNATL
jgi:hypothetical protein